MPELAKPLELSDSILKEQRSSKSLTVPLVQIRKELPLMGFSSLVGPTIASSLTDQRVGLPSQPVRSLPLKREVKTSSVAAEVRRVRARVKVRKARASKPRRCNPFRV